MSFRGICFSQSVDVWLNSVAVLGMKQEGSRHENFSELVVAIWRRRRHVGARPTLAAARFFGHNAEYRCVELPFGQRVVQGAYTGNQGSSGTQGGAGANRPTGQQGQSTGQTGVRDATYNLISVVYHALQGAEPYKMYEEDVERTQDSELSQFFRHPCEEEKRRAQQGKELLARHLQKEGGGTGGKQQLQSGGSGRQGSAGGSRSSQQSQQVSSSSGQFGSSPRSASSSDTRSHGRSKR